ncbi:hypothetical protein OQI87_07010 [Lactobacillus kefiranofaciens]|uniref:hypothetical protein n=1 Tax=Lactobacillus kefiranofaciens TaxID=267818 RepID=UPI0024682B72|nr:hypothetical protein [Lactobacillus kefiranofaciens]MDH5100859.1 hypothetical protein [Lactobacillus kefiranofaciens]
MDLNDEQFINTKNKFYDLLISENSKVEQLSAIFADYGEFLNNCVNNKHIDKRIIEKEIIRVQKIWEDKIYDLVMNQMTPVKSEMKVDNKLVFRLNKEVLKNPIALTQEFLPLNELNIVKIMETTDQNPLQWLFPNVLINNIFPQYKEKIITHRHTVDKLIISYVNELKEKYKGLFINNLEVNKHTNLSVG